MPKRPKIYLFDHSPHLREEWDYEKNVGVDPETITKSSGKKVWWVCESGHRWDAAPYSRSNGNGCNACTGRVAVPGVNDLLTLDPQLAAQICDTSIDPRTLTTSSGRKIQWRCSLGHLWVARVSNRTNGTGCPVCSGRKVWPGFNDIATTDPELVTELEDPNNVAHTVTRGSGKKVAWLCKEGHRYTAQVYARAIQKSGCPYCSGYRVLRGFNDLETLNPELFDELEDKKLLLSRTSHKKVGWICEKGHRYEATVANRSGGSGCSVCCNRTIIPGVNDLRTVNPDLAAEMDDENYSADLLSPRNALLVWWKCSCGHRWRASISNRGTGHDSGCPKCCTTRTSKIEQRLAAILSQHFEVVGCGMDHRVNVSWGKRMTSLIDIELANKVLVEYDGSFFHRNSLAKDALKTISLLGAGYTVVRIREQSKQNTLPLLNISHPDLLQIPVMYITTDENLIEAVQQIKEWLEEKNV